MIEKGLFLILRTILYIILTYFTMFNLYNSLFILLLFGEGEGRRYKKTRMMKEVYCFMYPSVTIISYYLKRHLRTGEYLRTH